MIAIARRPSSCVILPFNQSLLTRSSSHSWLILTFSAGARAPRDAAHSPQLFPDTASGLSPRGRYYRFGDKDRMLGCVDALPQRTLVFFWRVVKLLAVNANVNESLTSPGITATKGLARQLVPLHTVGPNNKAAREGMNVSRRSSQHSSAHRVVRREEAASRLSRSDFLLSEFRQHLRGKGRDRRTKGTGSAVP
jgi:hypothetical protein